MPSPSKSAHELIEELGTLVKVIWTQKENPEGLSKSLNDIAGLNWALANWQADLEEQERSMKAALDLEKATLLEQLTEDGTPVNKAEIRVTIKLATMRGEYNKIASGLERIKIMERATAKVMDSARSRLTTVRGVTQ